ncbi:class I SAM-dependent methyltransferase [Pseudomonas sp. TE3610]
MPGYVFGHSAQELERLMFQARVLAPITSRLISHMGIAPGMRVLDLGCGAGDVSMLVAQAVGESGSVIGIDLDADTVALARHRAQLARLPQIQFQACAIEAYASAEGFDAVIGRYIMLHQADPLAFLHKAASLARPGGVLGLHEIAIEAPMLESHPVVPLWQQVGTWLFDALNAGARSPSAAGSMLGHFDDAGLPPPEQFCERPIGGGADALFYRWAAEAVRTLMPHLIRLGGLDEAAVQLNTLEHRLRKATVQARAQLLGPTQVCAWVRL